MWPTDPAGSSPVPVSCTPSGVGGVTGRAVEEVNSAPGERDVGDGEDADIADEPPDVPEGLDGSDAVDAPEAVDILRGLVVHGRGDAPGEAGDPGCDTTTRAAGDPELDQVDGDPGRERVAEAPGNRAVGEGGGKEV